MTLASLPGTRRYDIGAVEVLLRPRRFHRDVEPLHRCGQDLSTLYSDGGYVLLTSEATLRRVNDRLGHVYGQPPSIWPFRPNIHVGGLPADAEDAIHAICSTDSGFLGLAGEKCPRCPVINVLPDSGVLREPAGEPLAAMRQLCCGRPGHEKSVCFGRYMTFASVGMIIKPGHTFTVSHEREQV